MPQPLSLVPESAPFTEEQRAWLNGFLAGWLGLDGGSQPSLATMSAATAAAALIAPVESTGSSTVAETEEDFPWHDSALSMDERQKLAEGRPLSHRLMASMAQLDCGSCGYDCRKYAEAIASGAENSLKLCSPGGKETAKKLKELVTLAAPANNGQENGSSNGHTNGHPAAGGTASNGHAEVPRWTRATPFTARIDSIRNLNGAGSSKFTSHVQIDLSGGDLTYQAGDSLGVYPTNCEDLARDIVAQLVGSADDVLTVDGQSLPVTLALRDHYCLTEITDDLIDVLVARCTNATQADHLRALKENADPIDGWDVLELLKRYPAAKLTPAELAGALSRLKPRLYSISSSPRRWPGQVHLTVGRVAWNFSDRQRKGVASTMFSDRLKPGDPVRVFVQKSHGFTVPQDLAAPAIMIGPGTGIAPFRAFLHERQVTNASGKNWLFFGDQRASTDFLYRDELEELVTGGHLTRLDVAFSRDQEEKIYVQHRMLEQGAEFWRWLEAGAHVYVCGDAKRMALDVDKALRQIIARHGDRDPQAVDAYVNRLVKEKRYCRDVY